MILFIVGGENLKRLAISFLINLELLLWLEFVFQLAIFDSFEKSTVLSILIFTILIALIITTLTNVFSEKVNKIITYVFYSILIVLYGVQLVFKNFFNTFFSFSLLKISDQAFDFADQIFKLIWANLGYIVLFAIPLILLIIFRKKLNLNNNGNRITTLIIGIILILLNCLVFILFLNSQKDIYLSPYSLYYEVNENELNVQKLGVINSYYLDIKRLIFGFDEKVKTEVPQETEENPIINYQYNITDIDIESLKGVLDVDTYNYIASNPGTRQNNYTGLFKGKNLIYIVAESFSEIAIDPQITPTLYKLTNSGFVFNNFYTPNYLSTIGGEFQALTGLIPNKATLSTWRNGNNYFPYGLSTIFKNEGYATYAYHDHSGYFQDRNKYLKALGFDNFKACKMGLNIDCDKWPESDVEMIEATFDEYMSNEQPFMTYYMTVSGHLNYNWYNSMAVKNKDLVKDLPYSDSVKAYLATQIELDRALELLIDKLEEYDQLDDTVIVLLADHYPYGLNIDEINELSTYKRDSLFEINHNKLIIWNNQLNTITVDKVAMSSDVLPTVYNLFGINYDSRLFSGTDILSTTEGIAIFGNRSWITDKAIYNATTNTYVSIDEEMDKDYIDRINRLVSSKIDFSKQIISHDYYRQIFKEA